MIQKDEREMSDRERGFLLNNVPRELRSITKGPISTGGPRILIERERENEGRSKEALSLGEAPLAKAMVISKGPLYLFRKSSKSLLPNGVEPSEITGWSLHPR